MQMNSIAPQFGATLTVTDEGAERLVAELGNDRAQELVAKLKDVAETELAAQDTMEIQLNEDSYVVPVEGGIIFADKLELQVSDTATNAISGNQQDVKDGFTYDFEEEKLDENPGNGLKFSKIF